MPDAERIKDFVAMVERGETCRAIEEFYHPDATMQENEDEPRSGHARLIAHETVQSRGVAAMRGRCVGPILIAGDTAVIRWRFTFTRTDGSCADLEEIAWQEWRGDRIAAEKFFYDPAQLSG